MKKTVLTIALLFISSSLLYSTAWTGQGLKMNNYGEVLVENLQIGTKYSMVELVNLPLEIENLSEEPIQIHFEVFQPVEGKIKKGFEAIPDTKWISVSPEVVTINTKDTYRTDVTITIPDDKQYLGKKYHADIRARIIPKDKSMLQVTLAVTGRFLFTLAETKQEGEIKPQTKVNMDFDILPLRLEMKDVPLGQRVKVLTEEKKPILLENRSQDKMTFLLNSLAPKDTVMNIDRGYEAGPDPEFLTFAKDEITVDAGKQKPVKIYLEIPQDVQYKDKKYLFLVAIRTSSAENSGVRYMRVMIQTQK